MGGDVHPLWRSVNHLVVNIFIGILDGQKPFFRCGVHFLSIFIRQHSPCAIVKLHIPAACIVQLMQYSNFFRPHRSFLVNMEYIQNISSRSIKMVNDAEIPIPHGKCSEIKNTYMEYAFNGEQAVL